MRAPALTCASVWLATTAALLHCAAAQRSAPDSGVIASAVLPPFLAADIPPVDPESWALLLERARKEAQSELSAQQRPEGVQVVRETFFVPTAKVGEKARADAAGAGAAAQGAVKQAQEQDEPANLLKTVGKLRVLRPLWTYAIHHPLRFLYSYALVPLATLLFSLLVALSSLLLTLLSALLSPLAFLFSTLVLSPLSFAASIMSALAPLWYALAGALACGTACGVLAGLVAGRSTRAALDETFSVAMRAGRWIGVLPKAAGEDKSARRSSKGAFGEGARLERFAPGRAASARSSRASALGSSSASTAGASAHGASARSIGKRRGLERGPRGGPSAYSSSGLRDEQEASTSGEEWDEEDEGALEPQTTTRPTGKEGWRGRRVPY
ncbi:hypothetical protein JCM9279_005616 [Rhodotorula babjevae]